MCETSVTYLPRLRIQQFAEGFYFLLINGNGGLDLQSNPMQTPI